MSRHRRNVPTSFYHRFATDVVRFSNAYARGKVVAVLEGGYSDRALASGTLAMLVGLTEAPRSGKWVGGEGEEKGWWEEKELARIEKVCKARKGKGTPIEDPGWLARTVEIFSRIEGGDGGEGGKERKELPRTMLLRQRKARGEDEGTPQGSPMGAKGRRGGRTPVVVGAGEGTVPGPARIKFVWKEGGV